MFQVDSVLGGICLDAKISCFISRLLETSRPRLANGHDVEGVTVFSSGIFVVDTYAGIVFKIENSGKDFQDRWECVKRAAEICTKEQLNLLVLPRQSMFRLWDGSLLIAEERLPLTHDWLHQEQVYRSFANDLLPALSQLTTFIIWSGFQDVAFRNIPVLDLESPAPGSPRRIALVDVENCGLPFPGTGSDLSYATKATLDQAFFGSTMFIPGLFQCILPTQFDSICNAALKNGVDLRELFPGETQQAYHDSVYKFEKRARIEEINSNTALFEDFAGHIIGLLPQPSEQAAAKMKTFPFQPRLSLELAMRAFYCVELSGIIFADDQGEVVAFIVHLTPRLAKHFEVLDSVFGEQADVKRRNHEEGWIVFATSLSNDKQEFGTLQYIHLTYERYGATFANTSEPYFNIVV